MKNKQHEIKQQEDNQFEGAIPKTQTWKEPLGTWLQNASQGQCWWGQPGKNLNYDHDHHLPLPLPSLSSSSSPSWWSSKCLIGVQPLDHQWRKNWILCPPLQCYQCPEEGNYDEHFSWIPISRIESPFLTLIPKFPYWIPISHVESLIPLLFPYFPSWIPVSPLESLFPPYWIPDSPFESLIPHLVLSKIFSYNFSWKAAVGRNVKPATFKLGWDLRIRNVTDFSAQTDISSFVS